MSKWFVGIAIRPQVGQRLLDLALHQPGLQQDTLYPLDKLHLTVSYLGALSPGVSHLLIEKLASISKTEKEFVLQFRKFDLLKPRKAPSILLALSELNLSLGRLYYQIKKAQVSLEIPVDNRVFRPHVTLTRQANGVVLKGATMSEFQRVNEFLLYQSEQGKYTVKARFPLLKKRTRSV